MRHFTSTDFRRTTWKNGGGETLELAVYPPNAGLDDFAWRISMATVGSDGPFSLFPGVDRTILVKSGTGVRLSVDDDETILRPGGAPFAFKGDSQTHCRLLNGPISDINVMSRRAACAHSASTLRDGATVVGEDQFFLVAITPLSVVGSPRNIAEGDLIGLDHGERLTIGTGYALMVRFRHRRLSKHFPDD